MSLVGKQIISLLAEEIIAYFSSIDIYFFIPIKYSLYLSA